MLILLPPSEGKSRPLTGPVLDLAALSFVELNGTRRRVLTELIRLCRGDADAASAVLGLGPTQLPEISGNVRLRKNACGPAIEVYTGVLYEALGYPTLTSRARRRAEETLAISSALWGLLRATDHIPAYRLSGATTLPGMGTMAAVWRKDVSAAIDRNDGLIVDLRSSTYASLGPLSRAAATRAVVVRVLVERGGRRTVVSHSNKATKGRLAQALVSTAAIPDDPESLAGLLERLGFRVELADAARPSAPVLDVIVDAA